MTVWGALWIAAGVVAFIGLVVLWGWYRHKLELEGQQLLRTIAFAYGIIAEEEKERKEKSRLGDRG